jgi:hypothetical protein
MRQAIFGFTALLALLLVAGCAGTRKLDKPRALQGTGAVAYAADERIAVTIDAVIVRDGPGSWAKNADWDEYLMRVRTTSSEPVEISGVYVIDQLGRSLSPQTSRSVLVSASKATASVYKDSGIEIHAGVGGATLFNAGATIAGASYVTGVAVLGAGASAATTAAAATAAVAGLLVVAPALMVAGAVRGYQNYDVDNEIKLRSIPLPLSLAAGDERRLNEFFALAPSPRQVEVKYQDAHGIHVLVIDTKSALDGLHIAPKEQGPIAATVP